MITPGLDLQIAQDACRKEGLSVTCTEVRSKKGVENGTPRVICIRRNSENENAAELLYAFFQCAPNPESTEISKDKQ